MRKTMDEKVNAVTAVTTEAAAQAQKIITLVEKVAVTIPINYYTKSSIKVRLVVDKEGDNTSYIDLKKREIHLSCSNIVKSLKDLNDVDTSELEMYVRSEIYHELSHAMLTPNRIFDYIHNGLDKNVVNVVEDERIETINRDYFMGVDFKRSIMDLCEYHGEAPTDAWSYFYHCVRFRTGEKEHLKLVREFIDEFEEVKGDSFTDQRDSWATSHRVEEMVLAMKKLFKTLIEWWFATNEPQKLLDKIQEMGFIPDGISSTNNINNQSNNLDDYDMNDRQDAAYQLMFEEDEQGNGPKGRPGLPGDEPGVPGEPGDEPGIPGDEPGNEPGSWGSMSEEEKQAAKEAAIEAAKEEQETDGDGNPKPSGEKSKPGMGGSGNGLGDIFQTYDDAEIIAKFDRIFSDFAKRDKHNQERATGWSGRFNTKNIRGNKIFTNKFFDRENPRIGMDGKDKINLVCVQDVSGSYSCNDTITNKIFYALDCMEEKYGNYFEWNLITVNNDVHLMDKKDHIIRSSGGTCLDSKIHEYIKKLTDNRKLNVYITLFDGGCYNDYNFSALNKENSIIIDSGDNETAIRRHAPKAKINITRNFTGELLNTLLSELAICLK